MGIVIEDGTYNATWDIAGFDLETSRQAFDGTTVDSGYGIYLIPRTSLTDSQMYNSGRTIPNGYLGCTTMQSRLKSIQTRLEAILGDHLVNRNVYLSTAADDTGSTNGKWTTAKLTLPSLCQIDGYKYNKYDEGEANYKLPLFNYERFWLPGTSYWLRNLGSSFYSGSTKYNCGYAAMKDGDTWGYNLITSYGVRPLIYVR